jgi:hypothetical protein
VDHGDLALAERHSLFSDRLNLVLDECVEKRPLEDRAAFVDEMFDAFEKSGVTDFEKMTIDKFAEVLTTLRSARSSVPISPPSAFPPLAPLTNISARLTATVILKY